MHAAKGHLAELILEDGCRYGRIACPEALVPSPGQYLLASDDSSSPLPVPVFYTDSAPGGFVAAVPKTWSPGASLFLRGPLGRGFSLPSSARRIALVALDDAPARLRGLIRPGLKQDAAVVLVSNSAGDGLPDEVEIQPLSALDDVIRWADFVALDLGREHLPAWKEKLRAHAQLPAVRDAQALIRTQMPCGGTAECGVCAVVTRSGWSMGCKEGPVMDWREI